MQLVSIRLSQSIKMGEKETAYIVANEFVSLKDTEKGYIEIRDTKANRVYGVPFSNIGHMVFTDVIKKEKF